MTATLLTNISAQVSNYKSVLGLLVIACGANGRPIVCFVKFLISLQLIFNNDITTGSLEKDG